MSHEWRRLAVNLWELGPIGEYLYRVRPWNSGYKAFQIRGNKQKRSLWCSTPNAAKEAAEKWAGLTSTAKE